MKVAVLFDGVSALAPVPDLLILETVAAIESALRDEGQSASRIPVGTDTQWIDRLRRGRFDLAFNLCEGIDGIATFEPPVIGVLELLGLPYSGSSSFTTSLCLRKHVVNTLLDRSRLPVPAWGLARTGQPLPSIGFPAICKPAAEDASLGIEQRSVVRNKQQLAERVGAMLEMWPEVIVQRYIDGREVNVGIVGDTVLPLAEVDFAAMPRGMWKIVSYRSKWETGCDEDLGTVPTCPAQLDAAVAAEVRRVALESWRLVGGEGYGRVDMRIDRLGRPWILEVNANPDIAPNAGLARMARVAGLDYAALVRLVCDHALARSSTSYDSRWARVQELSGLTVSAEDRARFGQTLS
ncbi:MAG: D-alanine--D-alanine ligase B [Gemmatimonadaceae bacterium]|nr:D-alanine--D-alanine ligase B [Gemmatimonadaceae bacterium]